MVLEFPTVFQAFAESFVAYEPATGSYDFQHGGEWTSGVEVPHQLTGIIVPVVPDASRFGEGGTYTAQAIRIYCCDNLHLGWFVEYRDRRYKIVEEKFLDHHADFNEFIANRLEEEE